jgi:hypothetical protein
MCVLILKIPYAGQSQNTNDTLCFKVSEIQNVLIAAKQKKYADSLVSVYRSDISFLNQKIQALETKDSTNKEINSTYQNMIGTMNQQRTILEGQITYLNKEVTKWKRKTKFAAISGIVLTGIVTSLFIFK